MESPSGDKDKALLGFFMSLRVVFKNASIYQMGHPAFVRCVEDLKDRLDAVFGFLAPLSLGFSPRSIYADGRFWEGDRIVQELGGLLHMRKVKRLEIHQGVALDELMRFSSKMTLPIWDFVKEGGAAEILKREKIRHISVEELDYSELLHGQGDEIKDIWPYLLQEAVEEQNGEKMAGIAESFERVIGKLDAGEFAVGGDMYKSFTRFFEYLKKNESSKYRSCARNLLKAFVTGRNSDSQTKIDNLRLLISDLKEEDLASTLWEEIVSNDQFDSLSFSVFSKLLESDRHQRISASLRRLFESDNPLNRRPEVEEKIRVLLSGTSGRFISEVYRQTLRSLLTEIRFDKKIVFDHHLVSANYHYILLNILEREKDRDRIAADLERILAVWDDIAGCGDFEFLSRFQDVLLMRRAVVPDEPTLRKAEEALGAYVEKAMLDEGSSPYFDRLISGLPGSRLGRDVYLDKIFSEGRLTPYILRAFYRFFKEDMACFTSRLKEKSSDRPFLERLIGAAKTIDSSLSLEILKAVYDRGDESLRIDALKAMSCFSEIDRDFLFPLLKSRHPAIKGEALVLLARRDETRKRALDRFLRIQSPYGVRNKTLKTNVRIVAAKELREAADHLVKLSRRKSFWNRSVRHEARRVLEEWDGRRR